MGRHYIEIDFGDGIEVKISAEAFSNCFMKAHKILKSLEEHGYEANYVTHEYIKDAGELP